MEKLTIQEEEVMIYIWELQCCFVKDIVAKYTQPAPPYTTVASIVKNRLSCNSWGIKFSQFPSCIYLC